MSTRNRSVIGLEDYEDAPTKRGYTTRHKEQQQQMRPTFVGRVRRWEKRWTQHGHFTVLRWERIEGEPANANGSANAAASTTNVSTPADDAPPPRKRARV